MRSLADDLRSRTDEQLAALVAARPDLLHPVPADITALAQRAGSPASVAACLRGYDQFALHVVLAAAMGPDPVRPAALASELGGGRCPVAGAAVDRVRVVVTADARRGAAVGHRPVAAPRRACARPHGPGRPRAAHRGTGPDRGRVRPGSRVRCGRCWPSPPQGCSAALERLLAGPVIGTVADARREPDPTRSPVDWLLAHHLLVPLGGDRVVLPAEVVAILRQRRSRGPGAHRDRPGRRPPRGAPRPTRRAWTRVRSGRSSTSCTGPVTSDAPGPRPRRPACAPAGSRPGTSPGPPVPSAPPRRPRRC